MKLSQQRESCKVDVLWSPSSSWQVTFPADIIWYHLPPKTFLTLFQNRVPATEEALMASTSCFTVHYRSLIINLNINTIWFINIHTISTSKSKSLKIPPVHFLAKFLIAHIILRNLCIKDILLVAISNLKRFVQGNASTAQRYWSWREQKCLLVIFEYYSLIIDTVDGTFDASIFYHSSKLWLAHTPVARY